jgi:agmatine deiminase
MPTYGVKEDALAVAVLQKALPLLEIVPINCFTLIKQHGSLHCVTMNFAKNTGAFDAANR